MVDATVEIEAVLATAVDDSSIFGTIKSYKYKGLKTLIGTKNDLIACETLIESLTFPVDHYVC